MTSSGTGSDLPDPKAMIEQIHSELKELKVEAKSLFREMENQQVELVKAVEEAKGVRKKAQMKNLKGNELIKLDHLIRMGYEEETIKEYLEKTMRQSKKELQKVEKDVANTEQNIDKMISLNKEAEKAVTAAQQAQGQMVVNRKKYQTMLDNAEVELYAEESRVKHFKTVKGVEITKDNDTKQAIKNIVKLVQKNCKDKKLVQDITKVAGKADVDVGFNSSVILNLSDSDSSDVEISSASSDDSD
jgi:hypothetical protein